MLFVSSMTIDEQTEIKKSHEKLLLAAGFYTNREIQNYLDDLENQKFLDLEDAICPNLYKALYSKYFNK